MTADKKMSQWKKELLAYCSYRLGKPKEALELARDLTGADENPERSLFLGQIFGALDEWDQALEHLKKIPPDQARETGRPGSDWMLKGAAYYSKNQEWGKTTDCVLGAKALCPDNPALRRVPEPKPDDQPIMFFQSGEYQKAIEFWKKDLDRSSDFPPQKIHLTAIAHQCLLETEPDLTPRAKIDLLLQIHKYWAALSLNVEYWREFFQRRREVYQDRVAEAEFLESAPRSGLNRCDAFINQFQTEFEQDGLAEASELLAQARLEMAVESQSARLISELRQRQGHGVPLGGLRMLTEHGKLDQVSDLLTKPEAQKAGTPLWFLKGLDKLETREAFVRFNNGDYNACLNPPDRPSLADLADLAGLAVIELAQGALQTHRLENGLEMAECIPRIKDWGIRKKATDLLVEAAGNRFKMLMSKGQRDEAIDFTQALAANLSAGPNPIRHLGELNDNLAAALLKRGENKYVDGDIDGWLKDYEQSRHYASDQNICLREFKKIVAHHLDKNFGNNKNFQEIFSFIERLQKRYSGEKYLQGQYNFFKALERMESQGRIDYAVVGFLEKAHRADPTDRNIAQTYSSGLTGLAIDRWNSAAPYVDPGTAAECMEMLQKALELDPANQHAANNLQSMYNAIANR